jgi:hypothetical protein
MTQTELECWVGQLGSHAMEVLAQRDGCPPTALVVLRAVPIATEVVLANDEDKALLRAYFEMAARGGAEACALVAEAWTARISTAARSLATQPGLKSLAEVPGSARCCSPTRSHPVGRRSGFSGSYAVGSKSPSSRTRSCPPTTSL